MSADVPRPIFKGTVPTSTTFYLPLAVINGQIGAHIGWLDATTSATITVELSSFGELTAPTAVAGSAWKWITSGVSVTGPAGSAAGGSTVNIENVRQKRARMKIVTAAASNFEIYDALAPELPA